MPVPLYIVFAVVLAAGIVAGWWLHSAVGLGAKSHAVVPKGEVKAALGAAAVRDKARYARASLNDVKKPDPAECGVWLGYDSEGGWPRQELWAPIEDSMLLVAPPGAGKTLRLRRTLVEWPGPVVATSTKLDITKHTARRRSKLGPTELFNPRKLGDQSKFRSTVRWNPVQGCKDPEVAQDRAGYLLSGTAAGGGTADREFWTNNANKVLRAYLHAAAHGGYDLMAVKKWANNAKDRTAVELLMAMDGETAASMAAELGQVLDAYDRFKESVFVTLAQVFDFLTSEGAREIVTVTADDREFNAETFLRRKGSLYLIGEHKDYGSIAPLFCALTGYIYDTAKRLGQERGDRLDPPLLFALDEAPNIAPLPLHRLTSEARGLGITFAICIQTKMQLEDVWGRARGAIIYDNCRVPVLLGGIKDRAFLEEVSSLIGDYLHSEVEETINADGSTSKRTKTEWRRKYPVDKIREMSDGTALVIVSNRVARMVTMTPHHEDKKFLKREARRAATEPPPLVPTPEPPRAQPPHGGGTPAELPAVATIHQLHTSPAAKADEASG